MTLLLHTLAAKDKDSLPVIRWVVRNGHLPFVRLLAKDGVIPGDYIMEESGLLEHASRLGHEEIVKFLVSMVDLHADGHALHIPLASAVDHGHEEIARMLLENMVELGQVNSTFFYSLLASAVVTDNSEAMVKLVLDKGADSLRLGGLDGQDLCSRAYHWGDEATVKLLESRAARPPNPTKSREAVFVHAMMYGNEMTARKLLKEEEKREGSSSTGL